jgi:hypothetical protein
MRPWDSLNRTPASRPEDQGRQEADDGQGAISNGLAPMLCAMTGKSMNVISDPKTLIAWAAHKRIWSRFRRMATGAPFVLRALGRSERARRVIAAGIEVRAASAKVMLSQRYAMVPGPVTIYGASQATRVRARLTRSKHRQESTHG